MTQARSFKILPLLIFVAFLSMAVRMSEIAAGVKHWSGAAFAESPAAAPPPEEALSARPAGPEAVEKAKDEVKSDAHAPAPEAENPPPADPEVAKKQHEIIWRDAGDSDVDLTSVKMEMFEDLVKRRKELEGREKDLATRQALLQATEQELERKYQELDVIRQDIQTLLKQQSEEEKARIESLVKIYEGMKAKEAAEIFNKFDDLDILVEVMTKMSERKLSPILAAMDLERARTVTIMMAEQKKLPELPSLN